MDRRFYTNAEVAELLRIKAKTLRSYHAKHAVYRPGRPGIWHVEHVRVLERVWAGALTEDEGWAFWETAKKKMRSSVV